MSASVFNMSLPEPLRRHAEVRARAGGYGSLAEYIRDLIRTDQRHNPVKNDVETGSPRPINQYGPEPRPRGRLDAFRPPRPR